MVASVSNIQTPLYGDKDAKLCNFRQKHKPPRAFLELVNDDKESMDFCPINGVPLKKWSLNKPVQPISAQAKQEYSNRKEREREKREAAAKGAILKKQRLRKKRSPPSGGGPSIPQPNTAAYALATTLHAPDAPTTQSSTPSDGHPPSMSRPQAVAQAHSAGPSVIPAAEFDQKPPPIPMSSTANVSHQPASVPVRSQEEHTTRWSQSDTSQAANATNLCPGPGRETLSGTPSLDLTNVFYPPGGVAYTHKAATTKHMMSRALHASRTNLRPTVIHAYATAHHPPLLARHYPAVRARTILGLDHPTPGSFNKFRQHTTSGPYSQAHVVPRSPCAPAHVLSSAPEWRYATDGAYTAPFPVASYAERYGGNPSLSPTSTGAQTPGFSATPESSPHTATHLGPRMTAAGDSMRGRGYFPVTAQQGFIKAEYHSAADTRMAMPTMRPVPAEYYHSNTVQQTNNGGVPQPNPTTMNDVDDAIPWHSAVEQGRHDVTQAAQSASLPQGKPSKDWSVPSAAPSYSQRSGVIKEVKDKCAYHRHTRTQHAPAPPQTIINVNAYPPKQSSYSELSHALELPTHTATNEGAHPTTEDFAAGPRIIVPPKTNLGFYAQSSDSGRSAGFAALPPLASPYAQGIVANKTVSDRSTHLWSQSGYAPPQCRVNNYLYPSVTPSSKIESTYSLTHIDSQRLVDCHGYRSAI